MAMKAQSLRQSAKREASKREGREGVGVSLCLVTLGEVQHLQGLDCGNCDASRGLSSLCP